MSKYSSVKTVLDGIVFDSKKEAAHYAELKLLERAGEISELTLQPEFVLLEGFNHKSGRIRAIKYMADFAYTEKGNQVVVDTKGYRTKEYAIKRKLLLAKYPDIDFREV